MILFLIEVQKQRTHENPTYQIDFHDKYLNTKSISSIQVHDTRNDIVRKIKINS